MKGTSGTLSGGEGRQRAVSAGGELRTRASSTGSDGTQRGMMSKALNRIDAIISNTGTEVRMGRTNQTPPTIARCVLPNCRRQR